MIATQYEPVRICAETGAASTILSAEANRFLTVLARTFEGRREELLDEREARRREYERGRLPEFSEETAHIRGSEWKAAPPRADLLDRRVELVGPAERRAIVAAIHSGANVFVADLAESTSPTWWNILTSQANLRDAVNGLLDLDDVMPAMMLRPRGWHLEEKHFLMDSYAIPAPLFDCGLFLFHNARTLIGEGTAPYFCLPGVENHREARLWNELFVVAEDHLRISRGTVRACVPIETISAAFEMDEILWELREHSAGLACATAELAASMVNAFPNRPEFVLPERSRLTMDRPFLNAYSNLMIRTCHRRGCHAIGGTSGMAVSPRRLRGEHLRDVWAGHDGTRVRRPEMVPEARDVFDTYMRFPNQIERKVEVEVEPAHLFAVPCAEITEEGLCRTVETGLECLAAWLRGTGTVLLGDRVENATSIELCCGQVRQWSRHGSRLECGSVITHAMVREIMTRHSERMAARTPVRELALAVKLFEDTTIDANFAGPVLSRAHELLN